MRLSNRSLAGLVAGILGAAIWATLSYSSGWELGYLAWAIGLAVGAAVRFGQRGRGGLVAGAIAAGITLFAISAGKAASVVLLEEAGAESEIQAASGDLLSLEEPELIISYLADEVVLEHLARDEDVRWPDGVDPCFVRAESDYPPEVWSEAAARWDAMDAPSRTAYIERIRAESGQAAVAKPAPSTWARLRSSFGPLDLVCFVLALASAFWIGLGRRV